jgi:hypothetical protein
MKRTREHKRLSPSIVQKMVQKLIQEKRITVRDLARKINTQPRIVEDVLRGEGEFRTKKTKMSLVKFYISSTGKEQK